VVKFGCYLDSLSEDEKLQVEESLSNTSYKFADGVLVTAEKHVKIPGKIGDQKVNIECDVVNSEILLLLSKKFMQTANTKIDFANNEIKMFGCFVPTVKNKMGHYCVSLKRPT